MAKSEGSQRFSINSIDWKKVGIGALVALAGALLTYGTTFITGTDFGTLTPMVVAIWSIVANLIRKFCSDNS